MSKTKISSKTKKTTLSAIFAALGTVVLFIGSLFNTIDLTISAIASFFVVIAVIEFKGCYPFLIYVITSILSLILLPAKYAAVSYALFWGFYPIFKSIFERMNYIVSWILKFSLFNTSFFVIIIISKYFLPTEDAMGFEILFLLMGNAAFLLFDYALSKVITLYFLKIRKKLGLKEYFD